METTLCTLCPELKLLVLQYLDLDELLNFSLVSKAWYKFISSDVVWLERFRLLEIKAAQTPPVTKDTTTASGSKRKSSRNKKGKTKSETPDMSVTSFYPVSRTLSAKQLREVRACKFRAIHKVKLAFWLYKTNMICNRFIEAKNIVGWPHEYMQYYGEDNEELVWNNLTEEFMYNVRFKIYHVSDTTQYKVVHLMQNKLANQTLDAGVRYHYFLSVSYFMLARVSQTSMLHVYRFSYESGQFEHKWILQPREDVQYSEGKMVLCKDTVTAVGKTHLWHWSLYTGEKLCQIRLATLVKGGETLISLQHVRDARLLLLVDYHTKKFVQKKVLLLDLADQRVLWTIKLNCLQSFMKFEVTPQYMVLLKNRKSDNYNITFLVYDVESGAKMFEVPYHPNLLDFKDSFLHKRAGVLVVLSEQEDYFYDLARQKEIKCVCHEDADSLASEDESVDMMEEPDLRLHQSSLLSYLPGPGHTLLRYRLFNHDHALALSLVDYRASRCLPVARLQGLKMWRSELLWDKHYRRLLEYYDHHICGTNYHAVW